MLGKKVIRCDRIKKFLMEKILLIRLIHTSERTSEKEKESNVSI